jgi:hypothetical protein
MSTEQSSPQKIDLTTADWLLSLTVPPMLLGIIAARAIARSIEELGQWSEEVFRGDHLPTLDVSIADARDDRPDSESSSRID